MPFISASVISPYNSIRGGAEGGLGPLLLDLYPNASAAYSLRALSSAYTGPAIEVRKTVGGVTSIKDIGLLYDGSLDTASLLSFAGSDDVFVTKWYDQSGEGNDAFQISQSSQASIVLSGVLNTTNGNVAALGTSNTVYATGYSIFNGADGTYSGFVVSKLTSAFDGVMQLNNISSGGGGEIFRYFNTSSTTFRVQSWDSGGNAPVLVTEPINANSNAISSFIRRLDSLTTSSNSLTNSLLGLGEPRKNIEDRLVLMGSGVAGFGLESYFSEAILYPSDQTANREGIETNINKNYNIYWDGSQTGLLDDYPSAVAAYSLRALNSAYTGPAIEARRSSDNDIKDIGFLYDGSLDTESLLSFAEGEDVFVAKWYDQSGNGNNVTNPSESSQPRIVLNGSLVTESGMPCIELSANPDYFLRSDFGSSSNLDKTLLIVGKESTGSDIYGTLVSSFDTTPDERIFTGRNADDFSSFASGVLLNDAWTTYRDRYLLHFSYSDSLGAGEWFLNSTSVGTGTATDGYNGITIGRARDLTFYAKGTIQEVILYPSDQSANRVAMQANINSHYNIYWDGSQTGLLDDYPNAAAAYSLRALNSAYTGPAIEARRSSDNDIKDIGFLYDGSLDTESLLSFAEGGDVFVAKWYDQSEEGNDVIQPFDAQQPQIVDLGSVVTLNGKPTILSSVGKAMYTVSNSVPVVGDLGERSSFSVLNSNASGLQAGVSYVDGGTNLFFPIAFNTGIALSRNNDPASNATAPYTANSDVVFTSLLNSTNSEVFLNGVSGGGRTGFIPQTGTSKINVFARYANVWNLVGQVSEIILYPSDQSDNREAIETNINNHYTIY